MNNCPTCGRLKIRPGLTERQTQVLHTIRDYISEKGFSPSFRDIAERCGIQKSAAHRIVVILADRDYVLHTPAKNRSLAVI
jgi:SOS-response transcriptional repressor LexA